MNNPKKYTIESISDKSLPVLRKYNVIRAGVFGSYAKNTAKHSSDIDMLVEVPRGTGLFKFASLKLELEKTLGTEVDLVSYKALKPMIREEILASEKKIL